jgi:class 3 adenylate cyclase
MAGIVVGWLVRRRGRAEERAIEAVDRGKATPHARVDGSPDAFRMGDGEERAPATPSPGRRERETTVLVCDVGSTAGDEAVPANVLRCLTDLQKVLSGIVGDEGGAIDRYAGERLIAVFAAERKNSDHAGRALEAAERIANNIGALSRRLQYDLRIGIGIHSGSLLWGEDGHVDSSAIGDAIDIASRLEALASEAKVSVVLTGSVLEHAERGEESFEILGEVPLGTGEQLTRIYTPRRRDGAVQLDLIDPTALRA